MRRSVFIAVMTAVVTCMSLFATTGAAAEWRPTSPMTIRVPFAAGGSLDSATRIVAQGLQEKYGQTVMVTNVTGAAGAIAANNLLAAPVSPNEMMSGAIGLFTLAPLFNKDINVSLDSFSIVASLIAEDFLLYVAPKNSGLNSYEDLVNYGKENRILFGANNPGGMTHLLQTALFGEAGLNAKAVTSSGSAKDLLALVSGDVVCAAAPASVAAQYVEEGSVTPILVFSAEPFTEHEGFTVPTVKSKGIDIVFRSCNFLMCRAGVDQEIIDQIYNDIQEFYDSPKFQELAEKINLVPDRSDGQTVHQLIVDSANFCNEMYQKYYAKK